jgi:hypothetical protein
MAENNKDIIVADGQQVTINFSQELQDNIRELFGSDEDLSAKINILAECALMEYEAMISGEGVPSKIADLMQQRLLRIIKNGFFENGLPSEYHVAALFQIPLTSAKTLLKNTVSKSKRDLTDKIKEVIKKALKNRKDDNTIELQAELLKDEINSLLSRKSPGLEKISAKSGTAGKYICATDTYNFLKEEFK